MNYVVIYKDTATQKDVFISNTNFLPTPPRILEVNGVSYMAGSPKLLVEKGKDPVVIMSCTRHDFSPFKR